MLLKIILPGLVIILLSCKGSNNTGNSFSFTQNILNISREAEIKLLGNNPDPDRTLDTLVSLSQRLKARISPMDPPRTVINKINDFIFNEWGVVPEPDTSSVENTSLHTVIKTHKASCLGLVTLYLAVTEDMSLPFYGVLLPGHLFIRYRDDTLAVNIETLKRGLERTDGFYRNHFKVAEADTYYLRNIGRDQIPGLLLFNLGNACRERQRYEEALRYYQQALVLFPDLVEAQVNLRNMHSLKN